MVLRQLAFASRARAGLRASETSEVIATSRANNARDGITGVLLYSGEAFLGIVEGQDAAIRNLWRRLLRDDRHRELATLFDRTGERWYADWRAGYVAQTTIEPVLLHWRQQSNSPTESDIAQLRELCEGTATF